MDYNEVIQTKNKILCIVLFASIILRCIVNAIVINFSSVIAMGIAGIVLMIIVSILVWKLQNPAIMMYGMVVVTSSLAILCMSLYPCTTNFMMFYLAIFMIIIYENIGPIALQCGISITCMIYFYLKDAESLNSTWTVDALAMSVVYIISGLFVFVAMCILSSRSFKNLQNANKDSIEAKEKAEALLTKIESSVAVLDTTSQQIKDSIQVTEEISRQIGGASEDIAQRAYEEVEASDQIRNQVEQGVEQIQSVSEASTEMADASNATNSTVVVSADKVNNLTNEMYQLNEKMTEVSDSILRLTDENSRIISILSTLDSITEQTTLLSLNASIEAARAGEHGKGFAVVASEIRNLSENSADFTEQIHKILDGINHLTMQVNDEIKIQKASVEECVTYVKDVSDSFEDISSNTSHVLEQARQVEDRSMTLKNLLEQTLENASEISHNVESTSAAMEEITSSITDLNSNISQVVSGYEGINQITTSLVEVAQ